MKGAFPTYEESLLLLFKNIFLLFIYFFFFFKSFPMSRTRAEARVALWCRHCIRAEAIQTTLTQQILW